MADQTPHTPSQAPKPAAPKEKKPGLFARMSKYLRDTRSEVKKIVWPNRQQVINNTGVVVVTIIVIGLIIGGLDSIFQTGLRLLLALL